MSSYICDIYFKSLDLQNATFSLNTPDEEVFEYIYRIFPSSLGSVMDFCDSTLSKYSDLINTNRAELITTRSVIVNYYIFLYLMQDVISSFFGSEVRLHIPVNNVLYGY